MGYKAGAALLRGISEIEPDRLKNFARIYGEQVKDALHAGAISKAELHKALKKYVRTQARDDFHYISNSVYSSGCFEVLLKPEILVYGLQNGFFSDKEMKEVENGLSFTKTLKQFYLFFGKKNLLGALTRELLHPPREMRIELEIY
jgi:hypothetical protein